MNIIVNISRPAHTHNLMKSTQSDYQHYRQHQNEDVRNGKKKNRPALNFHIINDVRQNEGMKEHGPHNANYMFCCVNL